MESDPFIEKQKVRLHCLISMLLNILVVVIQIVSISLQNWTHYCYFDWSLFGGETTEIGLTDRISGYNYYSDIDDQLCNNYKPVIDAACPDFCENLDHFESAGIVMLVFQILSCISSIVYILIHIQIYRGKKVTNRLFYFGVWIPSGVYIIGLTLYLAISNFYAIKNTWDDDEDRETGPGLALAYSILVLNFLPAIHSYIFTSFKVSSK